MGVSPHLPENEKGSTAGIQNGIASLAVSCSVKPDLYCFLYYG